MKETMKEKHDRIMLERYPVEEYKRQCHDKSIKQETQVIHFR